MMHECKKCHREFPSVFPMAMFCSTACEMEAFAEIRAGSCGVAIVDAESEREKPRTCDTRKAELREVREEIRLRSEVLRAFPDVGPETMLPAREMEEVVAQKRRFLDLLSLERELMEVAKPK